MIMAINQFFFTLLYFYLTVYQGHEAKSCRLSDRAQRMLGGHQWRAGVVAPPS